MGKADSLGTGDGRLPARLAATLEPGLQDALDHPVRRELLRTLSHKPRPRTIAEIGTDLHGFPLGQLNYHLQVLRRSGAVAAESTEVSASSAGARYASEVFEDGQIRTVLRATEKWDRERREAAAAASASPLLTMFRVPRAVRTIRLRSRGKIDTEREL
jgi:DNA-binding transcriptional ArsR family regulator